MSEGNVEAARYETFQTAEFTVDEKDIEKLEKLLVYAKKIGLPAPARDSFERDLLAENPDAR